MASNQIHELKVFHLQEKASLQQEAFLLWDDCYTKTPVQLAKTGALLIEERRILP